MKYTIDDLANFIDHTNLKADIRKSDIEKLCEEAKEYKFKMIAINQSQTKLCATLLTGSKVHVGAAIAFPLGQTSLDSKLFETKDAINQGADEIDYVINLSAVKERDYTYIEKEMTEIVKSCQKHQVISKVIFENCYLSKEEIAALALIAKKVKPDYIKTSTGFGTGGATVADVRLMKEIVGADVLVKAAGGIRDLQPMLEMLEAGATRIGTSSSVKIINEAKQLGYK